MPGIVDFHNHAFPDDLAPRAVKTLQKASNHAAGLSLNGTVGDLLRSMDSAGIRRSVICSIATEPKHTSAILNWSLQIQSERIIPFCSIHPECENPMAEVLRSAQRNILGIKLHPQYQDFAADDPDVWPLYRAIQRFGLILIMHCGQDLAYPPDDDRADPQRLLEVHRRFPEIPLVAAHMGGWRRWEQVAQTLAGTDVYLETSYSLDEMARETLATILAKHSIDRILFGSDSPWQDQARGIELVRNVFPDPVARDKVLGRNAERLLIRAAVKVMERGTRGEPE